MKLRSAKRLSRRYNWRCAGEMIAINCENGEVVSPKGKIHHVNGAVFRNKGAYFIVTPF